MRLVSLAGLWTALPWGFSLYSKEHPRHTGKVRGIHQGCVSVPGWVSWFGSSTSKVMETPLKRSCHLLQNATTTTMLRAETPISETWWIKPTSQKWFCGIKCPTGLRHRTLNVMKLSMKNFQNQFKDCHPECTHCRDTLPLPCTDPTAQDFSTLSKCWWYPARADKQ